MNTKTSRNDLPFAHAMPSELINIDTMYEICDAEFASDKTIHLLWEQLEKAHKEFRKLFARELRWKIQKISEREQIFLSTHACEIIAERIANDWWIERSAV